MVTKGETLGRPRIAKKSEHFTNIADWITPYGLIYAEFEGKDDPGVEFFRRFKDMIREVSGHEKAEGVVCYVRYQEMILKISHRVNMRGTRSNSDYQFVPGNEVIDKLQELVEAGRLKPFWIEIQGSWMNVMYSRGKKRYMTQIVVTK